MIPHSLPLVLSIAPGTQQVSVHRGPSELTWAGIATASAALIHTFGFSWTEAPTWLPIGVNGVLGLTAEVRS